MKTAMKEAAQSIYPQDCARVIADAQRVMENEFLFNAPWDMEQTQIPVRFAHEIDWEYCPDKDEEWTFMLARHGFVLHLAQAFALTENAHYAGKALMLIEDFMRRMPFTPQRTATVWRSLDAGVRVANWLDAWHILNAKRTVPPVFETFFRSAVRNHAQYLLSIDTVFCRLSNWGVIGNAALYQAALYLGDDAMTSAAERRLADESALQVMPDGFHWEQSPMYHAEVLASFLKVVRLAHEHGRTLPPPIAENTRKLCFAFVQSAKPNHHQFLQSDSDDTDLRDLITQGAVLLEDAQLKFGGFPQPDFESLFWLDDAAYQRYCALQACAIPPAAALMQSGNYYLRTGWNPDDTCTHFHCGRLGSGHGHADLLHVDVTAHGQDILVDSGRLTYVECAQRLWLKSCEAHNTFTVDGIGFTACADTWGYGAKAMPMQGGMFCDGDWMLAEGAHLGYMTLPDPVLAQRMVLQLGKDVTFILDICRSNGAHNYQRTFHFHNNGIVTLSPGGVQYSAEKMKAALLYGETECPGLLQTLYSPQYNKEEQKQTLMLQSCENGLWAAPAALIACAHEIQNARLREIPVTSAKTGEVLPRCKALAFTVEAECMETITVFVALEECIRGVDLCTAGTLCGCGRVIVRQADRQSVLAW